MGELRPGRALVTGAAGGIGSAIVAELASAGVDVIATDLRFVEPETSAAVTRVDADLTQQSGHDRILDAIDGRLDYLVNAAGVAWWDRDGAFEEVDDDVWESVFDINFSAVRRLTRLVLPALRLGEGKSIVHIASIAGLRGLDTPLDAYQVSKAAVVSLSRSLAIQLGPEGIRSNTVCPGAILTPMIETLYTDDPARRTDMERRTPMRRLGTPADVASVVSFLLSTAAAFVTGTDVVVDGGWQIQVK